jgi:thiol-disulfide isomerase/thioredoxin
MWSPDRHLKPVLLLALWLTGCASAQTIPSAGDTEITRMTSAKGVVVLNFWATWCQPCRTEIPALNRIHRKFPDTRFIGINMDDVENQGAIGGFLNKYPIEYEVVHRAGTDFEFLSRAIEPNWKGGIPATFVFKDGRRIFSKIGAINEAELETVLTAQ